MTFINMEGKNLDELAKEYYKLKNELNNRFISEKIGREYISKKREKLFKPITEEIKKQAKEEKELVKTLFPQQLAIDYKPLEIENPDNSIISTGPFGSKYLSTALNKNRDYDSTFGINRIDKSLTFGNKQLGTDKNDNIMINNKKIYWN